MIKIDKLNTIELETLQELIIGHESQEKYSVSREERENEIHFHLILTALPQNTFHPWHPCKDDLEMYQKAVAKGTCRAAFLDDLMVGIAIAEPHWWNKTLWLWEFHVRPDYHRQGIGWLMMEEMIQVAQNLGLRAITCETQNTNVTAIRFYRAMGFTMDSVDLSYYTNNDLANDSIAVFLKRKFTSEHQIPES